MSRLNDLQRLIDSLSPQETRTIRKILESRTRGSSNQLLDLYEMLLANAERKNTQELIGLLDKNVKKNLPTLQSRLRELILENLTASPSDQDIQMRLHSELNRIAFLFKKRLFNQVQQTLSKAKKLAAQFEEGTSLLQLLVWERNLVRAKRFPDAVRRFKILDEAERSILNELNRQMHLKELNDQIYALITFTSGNTGKHDDQFKEISSRPIIQSGLLAKDMRSRILALETLGNCHLGLGNTQESLANFESLVEEWINQPAWIKEYPSEFFGHINQLQSRLLITTGDLAALERLPILLSRLQIDSAEIRFRFNYYAFQQRFIVYMNFQEWDAARKVFFEAEKWMRDNSELFSVSRMLVFLLNFGVFHFLMEDFNLAKKYFNEILNIENQNERLEIRAATRLLNLIAYLEIGDFDYIEYQLRSTRAWFLRHDTHQGYVEEFFRLIRSILKYRDPNALAQYTTFIAKVANYEPMQGSSEILMWAESKVANLSIKRICELRVPEIRGGKR